MEIQLWREILDPYGLAVNELVVKFNHIIEQYKHVGAYSPIEQVTGRVKTISSILEKSQKKNIDLKNFEDKIEDIAGIRIICQFVEDIYKVVDIIKKRSDMRIKSEKDYIDNMKKSGYRSYHITVYYNVETLQGTRELQVEIQIRTLAMNFWATIEHSLQYKYKQNMPEHIRERLSSAAEAILILDREMSVVRDEIMDAQNSFTIKANIVADILTNIQNLYKVANKQEVIRIQDEFFRIYQIGDREQLEQFSKELDMISERYHAQSLR
ncbi:GTP pyrophosphokinase family protein [Mobilitalea sibirica]|uniref:GTP pyrophosphokinase family protein n=1 Tax=Mobilitalea sibirica TaxID=1462919 RepID=A0A8J7L2Y3_9FIRM|nr:GTP pyrophosphokinase family protein [Mobilitalea sibirica]MBH1941438.1 GTP pyrophosphokinase family protein [Mobilitalea sibirica]